MKNQIEDTVYQIVNKIISEMLLDERVFLLNMKNEDINVLQGFFDLYIRSKVDAEDEEYENITYEL